MSRVTRRSMIQFQIESGYGAAPVSWAATDAIQINGKPRHRIVRDVVSRDLLRPSLGGSEQMVAARVAEIEYDVELAGSGTPGTEPAWGKLLRACGMSQTITAGNRVEYAPGAGNVASGSIRYVIDGVAYYSRGLRGTFKAKLPAYGLPMLSFMFKGYDTYSIELALPSSDLTAFKRPVVLTDVNSGEIRLGGSYSAGAVTGGTVLQSRDLELDIGNTVSHLKVLSGERIEITGREAKGKSQVFLTAADEVTWRNDINSNVLTSLGFSYGTSAGNRVTIWAPSGQRVDPQAGDYEGLVMMENEWRFLPQGAAGNDELVIVAR
jgi:hypothetical protein